MHYVESWKNPEFGVFWSWKVLQKVLNVCMNLGPYDQEIYVLSLLVVITTTAIVGISRTDCVSPR